MSDHYELIDSDGLLVIKVLIDTLDFYEISESANFLRTALKERSFPSVAWDLTAVEFIDSSVFGFFIETRNVITKNGSETAIVCRNKEVLNIIFMLKINEIIRVFPSLEAALQYLRSR
ncbi:MAG TPA: STAS domain-containing protein [Spirochaetota bacterium]|nr:STAS domain-containing protein [Spirochaetota bacterium]HPG50282.1 STAS domain-containing protein [Spirochaetota bacterium]HPN12463.1 STAS domain-containing protein [Spirochaetota bacterium]HQL84043.1 STAS domain-containing protein [Spirochaetota bacterium]